ncbi:hypothetical protein MAIT1_04785 [Magnetofaba australis IT-1]|uniref:Uncharacterized protein n=1 Tax=Magnetofaba australis IT-1 TaxID=1434232 RepID=A0A1Y2KA86_9PROT|nr:hypothetical protein MAIT1_04785 [Magnetofaba australis IT-1]
MLLDAHYGFIDEKLFDPNADEPVSEHKLPSGYSGPIYALSMCNLHDVWLASAQA